MQTRTGGFTIGFRNLTFSQWTKDKTALIEWAMQNDLRCIDLGRDGDLSARQFLDAGITVGSVDLPEWDGMISRDAGRRKAAVEKNASYVKTVSQLSGHAGAVKNFFIVLLPEKPELPRAENFNYMTDSLNALSKTLDQHQGRLIIE